MAEKKKMIVDNVGLLFGNGHGQLVGVHAGCGWALHGLVFEFADGFMSGSVKSNGNQELLTEDPKNNLLHLRQRGCKHHAVNEGERIVKVTGFHLNHANYLCSAITLHMQNAAPGIVDRKISCISNYAGWKGDAFEFDVAEFQALYKVNFTHGVCTGITTTPVNMWSPTTHSSFPKEYKEAVRTLLLCNNRTNMANQDAIFMVMSMIDRHGFTTSEYLVVVCEGVTSHKGGVVLKTRSLDEAKAKLATFPREAPAPQRMICMAINGQVVQDPHPVGTGTQIQGGGVASGFNKWWINGVDIIRMNAIAQLSLATTKPKTKNFLRFLKNT